MFLASSNKTRQLLHLSYIQRVQPAELQRGRADLTALLAELAPGFRVLVDFGRLEAMEIDCVPEIGLGMELMDQRGVGLVVRVIPDPSKDIGVNILTVFHYPHGLPVITCQNLDEAVRTFSS